MKDEALRQALDYIIATNKSSTFWLVPQSELNKTVTAIKQALEQPEPEPLAESTLMALARRCLWIAYVWNDHNHEAAYKYAREEAQEHGIKSFDDANTWLTSPPKREWQGLTDEEVFDIWLNEMPAPDKVFYQKLCRSVEAKLKEKNT